MVIGWGRALMRAGLRPVSVLNSLSRVRQLLLDEEAVDISVDLSYLRLRRELHRLPSRPRPAIPMRRSQLLGLLSLLRNDTRAMDVFLTWMWALMARFSDLSRLEGGGARLIGNQLTVYYPRTKTDPTGVGRTAVTVLPERLRRRSLEWIQARKRQPIMFDISYEEVMHELKPMGLTAHSVRRGSIQHALARHARRQDVMMITGHRPVEAFNRYVDILPWEDEVKMLRAATRLW